MHRSLRLESLSLLPISVRRFASPAASGSIPDLERLIALLDDTDDEEKRISCLPVFYANLDPVGIPEGNDLATVEVTRAKMAFGALRGITEFKPSVVADLWPRLWAWILFFHAYRECLPSALTKPDIRLEFLGLFYYLGRDLDTKTSIRRTPGILSLVVDAWVFMVDSGTALDTVEFLDLCSAMDSVNADNEANLAQIVDSAGGSAALASLIVKSINIFISAQGQQQHMSDREKNRHLSMFASVLGFVRDVASSDNVESTQRDRLLWPVLVSAGLTRALTTAAARLVDETLPPHLYPPRALTFCFQILHGLLGWHRAMQESLASGLLPLVVRCATFQTGLFNIEPASLLDILSISLPASTIYYTVLAELQCGVIRKKVDFMRCSHCRYSYYCSVDCQRIDWRSGHRERCHSIRISKFKDNLEAKNRSFMRALLHKDIMNLRYCESPCLQDPTRIAYLRETQTNPSNLLVTVMDYTDGYSRIYPATGTPKMYIDGLDGPRTEDKDGDIYWNECISRAARSRGRMELHLMVVQDGPMQWPRRLMFPQRSECPSFHDGLAKILKEAGNTFETTKKIQQLLEADESGVKIH
ncbi:MYND-type domain-containing protein [Mycena venus]|uniref:MYND-type domain-containing protein n=1 Tax=Mycena venus TaxID=2733690 RepID=A0A8H6X4X8_9AGAR|nr:MYND-type domain-containing protein [Mycena venus]